MNNKDALVELREAIARSIDNILSEEPRRNIETLLNRLSRLNEPKNFLVGDIVQVTKGMRITPRPHNGQPCVVARVLKDDEKITINDVGAVNYGETLDIVLACEDGDGDIAQILVNSCRFERYDISNIVNKSTEH